jgi:sugar lactone lactonase YvrE
VPLPPRRRGLLSTTARTSDVALPPGKVPGMATARVVTAQRYVHGEGLRWDAACGQLMWVDLATSRLLRAPLDRLDEPLVHASDVPVGVAAPHVDGGWVLGAGRGIARLAEDGEQQPLHQLEPAGNRMNDGACDPAGRFWVGSMAYDESPGAGSLHVLDLDGSVTTVLTGLTISNGVDWSPDGSVLYLNDSGAGVTLAFDVDGTTLSGRRELVRHERGVGDGLTVDDEGLLWVALYGGAGVERYDLDGRRVSRVEVGAEQVSDVCLVDGTLFCTTVAKGLPRLGPDDGAIFAADVGVDAPAVRLCHAPVG